MINVGLAVPFAYFMRRGMRGEKLITFLLIVPITLGTVLVSEGMLTFMGPAGWLNQLLMALRIVKEPFRFTHNVLGVVISLGLQGFPYAFLMLLGYVSGINPDLEKAGQMLGANKWQTFWKILFPLMVPGIAISFCLNFVMAFSVFPSAVLLGQPSGPTRVISIAAYQWAFEKFNFNAASAISMVMAAIELLVIILRPRVEEQDVQGRLDGRERMRGMRGKTRLSSIVFFVAIAVYAAHRARHPLDRRPRLAVEGLVFGRAASLPHGGMV